MLVISNGSMYNLRGKSDIYIHILLKSHSFFYLSTGDGGIIDELSCDSFSLPIKCLKIIF